GIWLLKYLPTCAFYLHPPCASVTLFTWGDPLLSFAARSSRSACCTLENLWRFVSLTVSRKIAFTAIRQHFMAAIAFFSTSTFARHPLKHAHPAPNSLRLKILPASPTGSIFCPDFRLSPTMFSIFYEQGGGGRGGAPLPNRYMS